MALPTVPSRTITTDLSRGAWIPILLLFALFACGDTADAPRATGNTTQRSLGNIVEVAQVAGQFSTLLRAAQAAELAETLQGPGPFTVFAPTDGAFADLPEGTLEALLDDPETLAGILLYHVVPGTLRVADLRGMERLETVHGNDLRLESTAQGITVNGTYLLTADVTASNGIIHVITAVLVP